MKVSRNSLFYFVYLGICLNFSIVKHFKNAYAMTQQFHRSFILKELSCRYMRLFLSSFFVTLKNYKRYAVKTLRVQIKLCITIIQNTMQKLKNNKTQITCCRVKKILLPNYKYTAYKKNAHDSIYTVPIHMYGWICVHINPYIFVYICMYIRT